MMRNGCSDCLIKVVNNIGSNGLHINGYGWDPQRYFSTQLVVPLPPEIINSYIDKFPAIILLKLKEKFDASANRETKDLVLLGFLKIYSSALISQVYPLLWRMCKGDCLHILRIDKTIASSLDNSWSSMLQ